MSATHPASLSDALAADVAAIAELEEVPKLLKLICATTGMGFAAVARIAEGRWIACAVQDDIGFGLRPGDELDLSITLCREAYATEQPRGIDCARNDPSCTEGSGPRVPDMQSYVSVPIVLSNGDCFGTLCAFDPNPIKVSDELTQSLFTLLAGLIASQLSLKRQTAIDRAMVLDQLAASELRDQFIAILGHDLRNPLAAIVANAAVLERKTEGAIKATVSRIATNSKRMANLIEDVLDFARGRLGGGIAADLKEVRDLNAALAEVVTELRDSHQDRTIEFVGAVDQAVFCDVRRVQQLVSNLMGNALTHGSADAPIELVATVEESSLVLRVSNEGEPIPTDAMNKVFAPFWRSSTSTKREGLGLGLYICSQIVDAHRGRLEVTSSETAGTSFVARIPLEASGSAPG